MRLVDPAEWHVAVGTAMHDGHRTFVTLIGLDDDGLHVLIRLRDATGDDLVVAVRADSGVDTVIDLLPEAAWYEREAAEMFGITFRGHDTKPLLLPAGSAPVMRKDKWLDARQETNWPGEHDPGARRRRTLPPGVRP